MAKVGSKTVSVDLSLPGSWVELPDRRLCYLLRLIAAGHTSEEVRLFCLLRWNGVRVVGRRADGLWILSRRGTPVTVSSLSMAGMLSYLDWMGRIPSVPVRPDRLRGRVALPADLQGVPFSVFVMADNLYQGWLATHDGSLLRLMMDMLYPRRPWMPSLSPFRAWHGTAVFYWWASLKEFFAQRWTDFFLPAASQEGTNLLGAPQSPEKSMNAMIRALTRGDVTKEEEILGMDTWRALEELNVQARESAEFDRKYGEK